VDLGSPSGATFTSTPSTNGTVTGTFDWTPSQAQAPGNYSVEFQASDGFLVSSATTSITVRAIQSPSLAAIRDWTINDETQLTFKANATDLNIPPAPLTFSLVGAPSGASISSDGVFDWTPTETQSGVFSFTVRVSNGALTDSKIVTVTVVEVEQPPVLTVPGAQTVEAQRILTLMTRSLSLPPAFPRELPSIPNSEAWSGPQGTARV